MDGVSRISILVLWIACAGCAAEPVTVGEIAGKWLITPESRLQLQLGATRAELMVGSDGTFQAFELPADMLYVEQSTSPTPISGSGRWTVDQESGREIIRLRFLEIQQGRRMGIPYSSSLYVTRKRGVLSLYYFSGDPDEGNMISFIKS